MVALGLAVAVTLVLTFSILSLTLPGFRPPNDTYSLNLKEWVRRLAALVLLLTFTPSTNNSNCCRSGANWLNANKYLN